MFDLFITSSLTPTNRQDWYIIIACILLQLLGMSEMIDNTANRDYLLDTQDLIVGGFSKWPDFQPGEWLILFVFYLSYIGHFSFGN